MKYNCCFEMMMLILMLVVCTCADTVINTSDILPSPGNASACGQRKTPGLCAGKFLRYAYNKITGNCEAFYYSGCASSANNFLTYEECRRDCMQKMRY